MQLLRTVLAFALMLLPLAATAAPADDVKESFLAYKTALLTSDGMKAAEVVTQGSRELYRDYADQALTLDHEGLDKLHIADRITVMLMRHSLEPSSLETMSGRELIAYAVGQGWIDKEGTAGIRLGNYQVNGNAASGTLLRPDGTETPFKLEFVKEDGDWRLDLKKMLLLARLGIEQTVKQVGMSEDDFVFLVLEYSTGVKPGPDIWSPPL